MLLILDLSSYIHCYLRLDFYLKGRVSVMCFLSSVNKSHFSILLISSDSTSIALIHKECSSIFWQLRPVLRSLCYYAQSVWPPPLRSDLHTLLLKWDLFSPAWLSLSLATWNGGEAEQVGSHAERVYENQSLHRLLLSGAAPTLQAPGNSVLALRLTWSLRLCLNTQCCSVGEERSPEVKGTAPVPNAGISKLR